MDQPLVDAAAVVRWVGYAALFAVVGSCTFRLLIGRTRQPPPLADDLSRRAARIGAAGALILIVTLGARLYFQLQSFTDPGEPLSLELAGPIVTSTAWGTGWRWQVGAALLALAGLAAAVRWRGAWAPAAGGAVLSAGAASLTGHAIEHPWGALGTGMQMVHLAAGAAWLGTLLLIVAVAYPGTRGRPDERESLLAALVGAYSPMALTAGIATIALGLLLGWQYVGGFGPLFGTAYGRTLLVKVALLAGVAAAGAWNWRRVRPTLGAAPGASRLCRSATAELLFGTLLLAVTAILVALPAPEL